MNLCSTGRARGPFQAAVSQPHWHVGKSRAKVPASIELEVQGCKKRCLACPSQPDSQPQWARQNEPKESELEDLQDAIAAANAAFDKAESSMQDVEKLPSSRLPWDPPPVVKALRIALLVAAAAGSLAGIHSLSWPFRITLGCLAGSALGAYGYRKGSLSSSGGLAAAAVGALTLSASARCAFVLLAFFFTSSKLTTYCEDRKRDDDSFKEGGQRDWKQVFCNGFIPTILAVAACWVSGGADLPLLAAGNRRLYTGLTAAFLGYFSCCCGDTWASEVGQLSSEQPRLITTLRPVRKGTNGGVTQLGLVASAAGGLCVGVAFYCAGLIAPSIARDPVLRERASRQLFAVPLGLAAGLAGSLIDSLLGATVQFTGYDRRTEKVTSRASGDVTRIAGMPFLNNNAVNLVSASVVAAASAATAIFVQTGRLV